jgi:aminoglycoside phosphotransferase (APT) family kinase protein
VFVPDLDIEQPSQLLSYLRSTGRIGSNETPSIRVLAGGVSNRTVLVERPDGEGWVMKQALAKLRVKVDWLSDPQRVHQEARGLRWLEQLAPPGTITPLTFEDHEHHLLAMTAVPQPHENWKTLLLGGRVETDHVQQFARLLATVHRESGRQREVLAREFADTQFFESLRVEPYYLYTGAQVPEVKSFIDALVADTRRRKLSVVHGDYSPKNVLVHNGQLVLLDHEVIHFGDPAFDLGFSMTHLLSKAHYLREHRARFAEAARMYWDAYQQSLGEVEWRKDLEIFAVRHTLGCLLARVAGRSPLEYLAAEQRSRQCAVVIGLMADAPSGVPILIDRFLAAIG